METLQFKDKNVERVYKYLIANCTESLFKVGTKKELADNLDISPTTLRNKLKVLEEQELITVETKSGNKGGLIIVLNGSQNTTKQEEFETTEENILQSNQEYAKELREKYFPSYHYQRTTNKPRRTKKEMIEFNAIKDQHRKMIADMNFKVKNKPYPTKGIFNLSDDPEGYFKAYILSKIYDKLCSIHMKVRQRKFQEQAIKATEENYNKEYIKALNNKAGYYESQVIANNRRNTLEGEFFDSGEFTNFYNLYKKSLELKDFNVVKYMINVFSNVSYYFEQGYKGFKAVPRPNYFTSDKYIQNYYKYFKGIHKALNSDNRQRSNYIQRMNDETEYSEDTILQQLKVLLVKDYENLSYDLDTMFNIAMDREDYELGLTNNKQKVLLDYYKEVQEETKGMEEYDKSLVDKFVKQLLINDYAPKSFTNTYRLSMFPVQRAYVLETFKLQGLKHLDSSKVEQIGLIHSASEFDSFETGQTDYETNYRLGIDYVKATMDNTDYYNTRMFGHFTDIEVNVRDIKYILEKYDKKDLIPLTKNGMLSYRKLEEGITGE